MAEADIILAILGVRLRPAMLQERSTMIFGSANPALGPASCFPRGYKGATPALGERAMFPVA